MFLFLARVTRVPRPTKLSVAAAAGIVFTISGRFQAQPSPELVCRLCEQRTARKNVLYVQLIIGG
jgi:hypothetical protein